MPSTSPDLLVSSTSGLRCAEGCFHVDPWKPVDRAIITHAHGDHLVSGCGSYLSSTTCAPLLRERTSPDADITPINFGVPITLGGVTVSLHPAGHILGSAQVRVERSPRPGRSASRGETWVVSGDYKLEPDSTCEAFEPVPCDVFISESTFGLPIYRWRPEREEFADINAWWRGNVAESATTILFAYALGKAQRLLAGIDPSIGPIAVHGAVDRFNRAYRAAGKPLPDAPHAVGDVVATVRGRGLIVAPPSARNSGWIRKFAAAPGGVATGFASGWMQVRGPRRRKAVDRGFVISDHADWPGLLTAIRATGASRIGVTHGYVRPLVRWLTDSGLDAFPVPTRYTGEVGEDQESPDPALDADAPVDSPQPPPEPGA